MKNIDWALKYASRGWYVFPCHTAIKKDGWTCTCEAYQRKNGDENFECSNSGKHPRWHKDSLENGIHSATIDPDQIKAWWKKWPNANIGVNCGLSGILAVDLDDYKEIYQGNDLDLDENTVISQSGGGGKHLIYSLDSCDYGNSTKGLPLGIDIRGNGGYIIVPPSLHVSKNCYEWINSPFDLTPASIPEKLNQLLSEASKPIQTKQYDTSIKYNGSSGSAYGNAALVNQIDKVANAPSGQSNRYLNNAALSLGHLVAGGELDEQVVIDELMAATRQEERAAHRTIISAMEEGKKNPVSSKPIEVEEIEYDGFSEDCPDTLQITKVRPGFLGMLKSMGVKNREELNGFVETWESEIRLLADAGRYSEIATLLEDTFDLDKEKREGLKIVKRCRDKEGKETDSQRAMDLISSRYTLKMNSIEDMIEVDGKPKTDVIEYEIDNLLRDKKLQGYTQGAMHQIADQNRYHPVKDYLNGLEWDGKDHLSDMLKCIKVKDDPVKFDNGSTSPLGWLLIRRWLLGCVSRGLYSDTESAFKHQTPMLVLIGPQGLGKSAWVRWLCSGLGMDYHREGPLDPKKTDDQRCMVNRWIWEVSELGASLRRSDRDSIKSFITNEHFTYRTPYAKNISTRPMMCNLVGTLNPETGFLDDPTGSRRFLPVDIDDIDHRYSQNIDVNQLWAQIVHILKSGESPKLTEQEQNALASCHDEHEIENPLETYMRMYFTIVPRAKDVRCHTASIIDTLRLNEVRLPDDNRAAARAISDVLSKMDLKNAIFTINGIKARGWYGIEGAP